VAEIDQRRLKRLGGPELKNLKRPLIDEVHVGNLASMMSRCQLKVVLAAARVFDVIRL
jgi:hypothetical protein